MMNRQVIAERLREHPYDFVGVGGVICEILHLDFDYTTDFEIEDILADLIDPTCKRVSMDAAGNPPYHTGGLVLDDVVSGCSACGYPFKGQYHNLGNLFNVPNYCPNCGARVVNCDGV